MTSMLSPLSIHHSPFTIHGFQKTKRSGCKALRSGAMQVSNNVMVLHAPAAPHVMSRACITGGSPTIANRRPPGCRLFRNASGSTGSGYMTALLASLGGHVTSVEIVPEFTQAAGARLAAHGIANVTLETGDAARRWDRHSPYDAIVLTGSLPVLPDAFQQSLLPGGRLFAVVGEPPVMQARLITCGTAGACSGTVLFETCTAPLRNALQPARFVF